MRMGTQQQQLVYIMHIFGRLKDLFYHIQGFMLMTNTSMFIIYNSLFASKTVTTYISGHTENIYLRLFLQMYVFTSEICNTFLIKLIP